MAAPATRPATVLDTRDVDEARDRLAAAYCEHRLTLAGDRSFHAVQTESRTGGVRVHRLRYGTDLSVRAAPLGATVLVTGPRRGVLGVTSAGAERRLGPGDVVAIDPDSPFSLAWQDGCELHTVQVDRRLLDAVAPGTAPVPLAGDRVVRRADAVAWWRLVALLEAGADDASTLWVDRLEDLVATAVLGRHAVREPERGGRGAAGGSREVARAVALAEEHAHEPLRAADLAAAAHLSVRGLQLALRRELGLTPTELVLSVRLARAHDDLRAADPGTTTVAAVAHRWGFGHAGRFAARYTERYGVPPSQTLHG